MVAELCFWVYCSSLLCPFTHPAMGNVAGAGAGVTGWFEPCARQTCSGCTKRNLPAVVVAWDPGAANAPVRAGFSAVLLQGGGGGGGGCCHCAGSGLLLSNLFSLFLPWAVSGLKAKCYRRLCRLALETCGPWRVAVQGKHCSGLNWGCFRLHSSELISQRQRHYSPIRNVSVFFLMRTKHFIPVH